MSHFIIMKDGSPTEKVGRSGLRPRENISLAGFSTQDDPGERARRVLFLTSERHSARVRRLQIAIIAVSVSLILLLGSLVIFNPFKHLPKKISIGAVQVEGTNVIVEKPKIAGLQQNGLPFEITALLGREDILKPNILELSDLRAKITLANLSQLEVLAKKGVYDNQSNNVLLSGEVRIRNIGNYSIEMEQASLNFKTDMFYSDRFSSMRISNGKIMSHSITISNNGERISFEGSVKSSFDMDPAGTEQE